MNKPLRVLQVFSGMDRGGAESMIMNIYRNIDRNKVQFDFIVHTGEKCDFDDEIVELGGRIYRVPAYNLGTVTTYKKAWREFFQNHPEYQIIHSHVRSTAWIYLKMAKKMGMTTIIHSHNISSGKGVKSIIKTILQYPLRWTADYFFACSPEAGKWLFGKKIIDSDRYYILKNAIQANKYKFNDNTRETTRNMLGIGNKQVIGHVGRFHPQKNHKFLIEVFSEVVKKQPDTVLILIGRGGLQEELKKKVIELGLSEKVMFLGVRDDISDLMQVMDIFLFPSLYEGLGIVAIEAQAAGLKCILSDTIPKEVEVTKNLVEFIALNKSKEYWSEKVINNLEYDRVNTFNEIVESGYEIEETTEWISCFYKEKVRLME